MKTIWMLIPLLLIGTVACSSLPSQESDPLSAHTPLKMKTLVDRFGPPTKVIDLPNGDKEYVFNKSTEHYEMAYGGYGKDTLNPITHTCETVWLIKKDGTVTQHNSMSNQCAVSSPSLRA